MARNHIISAQSWTLEANNIALGVPTGSVSIVAKDIVIGNAINNVSIPSWKGHLDLIDQHEKEITELKGKIGMMELFIEMAGKGESCAAFQEIMEKNKQLESKLRDVLWDLGNTKAMFRTVMIFLKMPGYE